MIPFLTGTVLPALGVGALSGLASTGVQTIIGNGLYLQKGSGLCRIETDGAGLYLEPASGKGFETVGNSLYMMKQGGLYDGRGLILSPDSPFKNTSILGMNLRYYFQKKKLYRLQMEIVETDGKDGHINRLKKIDEIQKILVAKRDKRKELCIKYNRGVNIIGVINNCLGVTAIVLGITGVSLLSTIVAAPAVIGMEAASIVMGLLRVVGNREIKRMSLKIEKHEQISMLAVSTLNTISSLISKAFSDNSISDEEYSLILLVLKHERKKTLE